jgi:hypothetical protein
LADLHSKQLVLIAGVCLVAGMVLIGLPVGDVGPLGYLLGGILVGVAVLLLLSQPPTF